MWTYDAVHYRGRVEEGRQVFLEVVEVRCAQEILDGLPPRFAQARVQQVFLNIALAHVLIQLQRGNT